MPRKTVAKTEAIPRSQHVISSMEEKENNSKERFEKSGSKGPEGHIRSNDASPHSSDNDDFSYTSLILKKRKGMHLSDMPGPKWKGGTLPALYSEQDSRDGNDSSTKSLEIIITDAEETNQNSWPEFKSCLARVLANFKKILSTYELCFSDLMKKYCENDTTKHSDIDHVMFVLGCIVSKLKEDLDKEEKSLKMSYGCKERSQELCAVIEEVVDEMSGRLVSKNDIALISSDEAHDVMPADTQAETTLPEGSKDLNESETQNETVKHGQPPDNENHARCETFSKKKKAQDDIDPSTKNDTNQLAALSHLTEISIEKIPRKKKSIDDNSSSTREEIEGYRSGYDTDISSCSTVIYEKPSRTDGTSVRSKELTSVDENDTSGSEILTKSKTTVKKRKRVPMISDSDSASAGSEKESYRELRSPLERFDGDCTFPSNRKTVRREATRRPLSYLGSQIFGRTSPVRVYVNMINHYSDDGSDGTSIEHYTPKRYKKTLIQNDIKLRLNCAVNLCKLK